MHTYRWWHTELEHSFPGTFHTGIDAEVTNMGYFMGLFVLPVALYSLLWQIPYFIILFFVAGMYSYKNRFSMNVMF